MSNTDTNFDIDHIRKVARRLEMAMDLYRPNDPAEFIAALAEYERVALYVNGRLEDAHDRLRQGSRTDAINSLEAEPNAMECLQEIDAVDGKLKSWQDNLDFLDVRRPPRLATELAVELSGQYDTKHQIANELRVHRLLALGGGALEQRVMTLRRLIQLDPDNRYWEQDLLEYEKNCQIQLQQRLTALNRSLESGVTPAMAAQIEAICTRLADPEWREPVDATIVRQSQGVLQRARTMHSRANLAHVSEALISSRADDNAPRSAALLAQWERIADTLDLRPDDPLLLDTAEARSWTQDYCEQDAAQEQVAHEVNTLSSLCAQPSPWTPKAAAIHTTQLRTAQLNVQALAARAGQTAEVAAWATTAERKIQSIQRRVWLFYGLASVAVFSATGLMSSAAYVAWHRYDKAAVVNSTLKEIERLKEAGHAPDLWTYISRQFETHPWLEEHGKTRHLPGEVDTEKEKATQKSESFQQTVSQATAELDTSDQELEKLKGFEKVEPGITATRDAVLNHLALVDRYIGDAQKLLGEIKQRGYPDPVPLETSVRDVGDRLSRQRSTYRGALSRVRDSEVERIRTRMREVGDSTMDAEALTDATNEIKERIKEVERLSGKPEPTLQDEVASLVKSAERNSDFTKVTRAIDRASNKGVKELLKELTNAKDRLSKADAEDVDSVIETAESVDSATKWSSVADEWYPPVIGPQSKVKLWNESLKEAMELQLPYPDDGPIAEQLATLSECLQEIMKPEDEIHKLLQPLEDLLNQMVMQDDVIEVNVNGAAYFTTLAQAGLKAGHFKDESTFDDRTIQTNFAINDAIAKQQHAPATHLGLAQKLRVVLEEIKADRRGLDDGVLDMIDIVYNVPNPKPEPLLRIKVLSMLLDLTRSRVFFSDNTVIETLAEEIGAKVGEVPWVVHTNPIPPFKVNNHPERTEAQTILVRLATPRSIRDQADKKRKSLGKRPEFCRRIEYVGWAKRTSDDAIIVSGTPTSSKLEGAVGTLYKVSTGRDDDTPWELEDCGLMKDGKPTIRSGHGAMFGQPIFLERAAIANERDKKSKP